AAEPPIQWATKGRSASAEEIHFPELDAVVPQNVVSRRGVEEEIRKNMIHEIRQALHAAGAAARLPGDRFVFGSIELLGFECLQLRDRLADACDEFRKRDFGIL